MPDITGDWGRANDPVPISDEESKRYERKRVRQEAQYKKKLEEFSEVNKINERELKELGFKLCLNGETNYDICYHTRNSVSVIAEIDPLNYKISFSYHTNSKVLSKTLRLRNLLDKKGVDYEKGSTSYAIKELKQQKQKLSDLIKKLN